MSTSASAEAAVSRRLDPDRGSSETFIVDNLSICELGTAESQNKVSVLERGTIGILGLIPGLRGLTPSYRVIRAVRGSTWTMLGYAVSQILRLASTLVLARMLVPQAFGLVALVNVFLSGLEMLSDLGIGMDVVQHPRGDDPSFINTAFLIQAGRGVVLCSIAVALAYPFARFYGQPAVLMLLMVGSTSVLLRGLTSGSIWGLTRHVQLGRYNLLVIGSDFFGFVVSLVWAILSPTAWALVVGRVAGTVALVGASHLIATIPVSATWDSSAAKDIFAFGSGIFLSTATYFLGGEAERLVVGKFVTLVQLGCFSIALSISSAAAKGLQQIVTQVFFPLMSDSLREDRERAIGHFKKVRHVLCIVSACLAIGFIFGSHRSVLFVLGPKYLMAGWMLQLLGVRGALELFIAVPASMLFALGTSRYAATGNVLKLIFLAIGLGVAFGYFGLREALWVLTLAPLANYIPLLFGINRHCRAVLRTEVTSFAALSVTIVFTALVSIFGKAFF
jgi:O-antigen/teichoic acid export membrane protein